MPFLAQALHFNQDALKCALRGSGPAAATATATLLLLIASFISPIGAAKDLGTVENWAYLLNYADSDEVNKTDAATALIHFIKGQCEPKQPKGASLKLKPGPLSHITLDARDIPKSWIDRIHQETSAKVICYVSVGTIETFRAEGLFKTNKKTGDLSVARSAKTPFERALVDLHKNGQIGGKMRTDCRESQGNETFESRMVGSEKVCFWPGEFWVLPSGKDTKKSGQILQNYIDEQLKVAEEKGCDGIELDNLDGVLYKDHKNKNVMSLKENMGFVNLLNEICGQHPKIACGYKNAIGVANPKDVPAAQKPDVSNFAFVVQEECHGATNGSPTDCQEFVDFFKGKPVLNIEYPDHALYPYTHPNLFTNYRESQSMNEMTPALIRSCLKATITATPSPNRSAAPAEASR